MEPTMAKRSLTGIKPTGIPHIANYIGAIRPALALGEQYDAYYFIADYHALTTVKDRQTLIDLTYEVAAAWLAMGLNPDRVTLYRQSDVPETFELTWILGLDGRKMSKSYANVLPLFAGPDEMARLVRRFKTDSTGADEPKDPESTGLFQIYREIAAPDDARRVRAALEAGRMSWKELK